MNIFLSDSFDPYINLSYENYLFMEMKESPILFLYKNNPSIIYGRFQNPWLECNVDKMLNDDINFVRRQSGGGCVYHDLGNLNFSFLSPKKSYSKDQNANDMLKILNNPRIHLNDRHDLRLIDDYDYKISGSAFKEKKDRGLHHCTLLLNSDLDKLNFYLNSYLPTISSKSSKSVRSSVSNLSGIINEEQVLKNVESYYQTKIKRVKSSDLEFLKNDSFYKQMISHEWIFDETPLFAYDHRLFQVYIKKGIIKDFKFTFEVHPSLVSEISEYIGAKNRHVKEFAQYINASHTLSFYAREKVVIQKELRHFLQVYFFKV